MAARLLAARIEAGDLPSPFAGRDVYRMGWTGLDKERTEAAIDVLLSLHWLEERIEGTTGRSKTRYAINPRIEIPLKPGPTEPTEAPSVSSVSAKNTEHKNSETPEAHVAGLEEGEA